MNKNKNYQQKQKLSTKTKIINTKFINKNKNWILFLFHINTKYFQAVTIGAAWASDLTANGLAKNFTNLYCLHHVNIRDVQSFSFSIFHYLVLEKNLVFGNLVFFCSEQGGE
jgi:hypothetical protein